MQKTKTYSHLCRKDRDVIYRMKQRGEKQEDIADTIGTSQSTVSRELKRNWQRLKKKRRRVITEANRVVVEGFKSLTGLALSIVQKS